jgi:chromate transporter
MREWGVSGQVLGAGIAALGIFLPGILMIFFVVRFWDQLKQYRAVRASLEGINAASTGLTIAAGISLFEPMATSTLSIWTIFVTFILLIGGLGLGILLNI